MIVLSLYLFGALCMFIACIQGAIRTDDGKTIRQYVHSYALPRIAINPKLSTYYSRQLWVLLAIIAFLWPYILLKGIYNAIAK